MSRVTEVEPLLRKLGIPSGSMKWAVWAGTAIGAIFLVVLTSAGPLNMGEGHGAVPADGTEARLRVLENQQSAQTEVNKRLLEGQQYLQQKIDKIYENTKKD